MKSQSIDMTTPQVITFEILQTVFKHSTYIHVDTVKYTLMAELDIDSCVYAHDPEVWVAWRRFSCF